MNTKLYWHVYVSDRSTMTYPATIWSFTPVDTSPSVSSTTPASGAVVASTTPLLSAAGSDPNGTVEYNFTISGGADLPAGRASSGWVGSSTWRVPDGVLEDGQAYSWSVTVREAGSAGTIATTNSSPSQLRVNQRLGSSGPAPTDALGPVTVGLANGNASVAVATHSVTSVGGPLGVGLSYNSQAARRNGLLGAYYQEADRNWAIDAGESPALVRVDPSFDLRWNYGGFPAAPPGMAPDQFLVRWTGYLTLPTDKPAGTYQLGVTSDDGARITVGGTLVHNDWTDHGAPAAPLYSSGFTLTPGLPVPIIIEYYQWGFPGQLTVSVKGPGNAETALPSSWLTPNLSVLPPGMDLVLARRRRRVHPRRNR